MPIKIRELDPKTGKPKKKMPLPKPKPRHANPKHPMNTERTGPLRKAKGGKLEMVEKGGKKVPFFAADGVGKMAAGGSMKIKSGDTLSQIAKSKGISLKSLLAANPSIKNANKIRVGQSIKIPGATAGAGAKSSNPYAGMTKTQMRMMDVKNKDSRKQEAATRGMQAQGKMGGQQTPTKTSKNPKLDELRSRIKRAAAAKKSAPKAAPKKAAPSMSGMRDDDYAARSGGMMNKKVMAYKKGGVMRGTGAATKGKGFSGCY
jgi:LysM repeat protein